MVTRYRPPHGGRVGPLAFSVRLRLADGTEVPLPGVTADTPADAARLAQRDCIDFIRGLIRPPLVIVQGPFGSHTFPADKAWRGRRPTQKETAALFDGR
jgi:hypothetical protein